jgi:hypothetical protein
MEGCFAALTVQTLENDMTTHQIKFTYVDTGEFALGRGAKGIVPSSMRPTQSGKRMSQVLNGVRQAAKDRKQERFTALLHHLSVALLREQLLRIKATSFAWSRWRDVEEYEAGLEDRLVDLHMFEKLAAPRLQPIRSRNPPKPNVGVQQNHCKGVPVPAGDRVQRLMELDNRISKASAPSR